MRLEELHKSSDCPQFELAYYGCDSVIPVIIPSKLKISFQARKSPRRAWSIETTETTF